jgi:Protein of unknown function (DUF5663)
MQFDDQFFQTIGLGSASDEDRAEMISKLAELVQGRVALKLTEVLTEEQLEHFDKLLEGDDDDAALAYVQQVYPQYPQLLQSEVDAVKKEFTGDVQQVMGELKQPPAA